MNFDFGKVEKPKNGGLDFIGYGINHDAVIVGVNAVEPEGKNPYLEILFKKDGADDSRATKIIESLSEKAAKYTMQKLKTIHGAVQKDATLASRQFTSASDMATQITAMWTGRKLRLKLNGEEYIKQDGNVGVRVKLPMYDFVEAVMEGAELPVIKDEDTKLEFNKSNKWDYKAIETADAPPKQDVNDDLPF